MYIYIWVVDVAGRLKKEPDFFLNYHNSGSFYFWLLLKREISDKRCHCWTFTIFTYQAFIDFHSRPSHIYITFWVTHFCEHQPAQSTRGLNAGQMRSCLQPFNQAVQWNSSWEFKYHCLVRLFFFFQSWWQWPACAGRKTGTVKPWRLKPANAASVCSTGHAAASHRETLAWWLKFTGFAFPL